MIMIGSTTRRLTLRLQSVSVITLSALREHLKSISSHDFRFEVDKVTRDRVRIRCDFRMGEKAGASFVVLPAYPTGHPDDVPNNPNVVLDPLEFTKADTHEERKRFLPLLSHDVLTHYEKMHPNQELKMARCC